MTFREILKIYSKVTGREGVYFDVCNEQYEERWGISGNEFTRQVEFGEVVLG